MPISGWILQVIYFSLQGYWQVIFNFLKTLKAIKKMCHTYLNSHDTPLLDNTSFTFYIVT